MSETPEYLNDVPEGYDGPRCQYVFKDEYLRHHKFRCGLPAWEGAPEEDPRCEFNSEAKPDDLKERLEGAVRRDYQLLEANLSGANLESTILSGASLYDANLSGADLRKADLSGAVLRRANLSGAVLISANLSGASLEEANLSKADLFIANLSGASLKEANLSEADLDNANLSGANLIHANLSGAILRYTTFLKLTQLSGEEGKLTGIEQVPNLRDGDLRGALFTGIELDPTTNLAGAKFGPVDGGEEEDKIGDELLAEDASAWKAFEDKCKTTGHPKGSRPTWSVCAAVYRQLKLAFQQQGDYERAGNFFFRERHCQHRARAQAGGHWLLRIRDFLLDLVAGYGEKPARVAGWALVVVVVFALLQWPLGLWQYVSPELGAVAVPRIGFNFGTALYHSCVTFTTLGFGDITPSVGFGRLLASIEAVCGLVLTSLYLICLVRKFSR